MPDKPKDKPKAHYIGHRKRLRGRFRKAGRQALQDYEILELLLGYALPQKDLKPLAKRIIEKFGSLQMLFDVPYEQLEEIDGVGEYTSTLIRLVRACMARYMEPQDDDALLVSGPESVIDYLRSEIGGSVKEQFMLLCLNAAGRLIHSQVVAEGTVDAAHIYPREILKIALERGASAVILVHNHPSGTLKASDHDMNLTKLLSEICSQVGIAVHDHLIVSRCGAYSIKLGTPITATGPKQ
jgi:DNA repair protein RadC